MCSIEIDIFELNSPVSVFIQPLENCADAKIYYFMCLLFWTSTTIVNFF